MENFQRGDTFVHIKLDGTILEGTILAQVQKLNGQWYLVCETKEGVVFMTERGQIKNKKPSPLKWEHPKNVSNKYD